ncbi:MAG: oxaloacetate decarboxylase subunit alpha, partial [Cetobacterium sp.]
GRPADLLKPEYDEIKKEIGELAKTPEDVLMYAMFPQIGRTYLENRDKPKIEKEYRNINIVF